MSGVDLLLAAVREHAQRQLRPLVEAIDREGLYPESYLRELAALGGFAALGSRAEGGSGLGLAAQIAVLDAVGAECGATAFMAWCQSACAWYLHQSQRPAVRAKYLADVLHGRVLAGTGMSNTVKHLSGIEKNQLQAVRQGEGFVVSGALPWVSNIGEQHVFAVTAQVADEGYVMFMVNGDAAGVSLKACAEFCALEGTRTLNVRFDQVVVAAEDVLAMPSEFTDYLRRIKSGFILLQVGIGAGVIEGCLKLIRQAELAHNPTDAFLDDGSAEVQQELDVLRERTAQLANLIDAGTEDILDVLELRASASELALAAAQSAALHSGAKGYLMRHAAQRRNREALFVAIVTPALKHLRYEIDAIVRQRRAEAA